MLAALCLLFWGLFAADIVAVLLRALEGDLKPQANKETNQ